MGQSRVGYPTLQFHEIQIGGTEDCQYMTKKNMDAPSIEIACILPRGKVWIVKWKFQVLILGLYLASYWTKAHSSDPLSLRNKEVRESLHSLLSSQIHGWLFEI